MSETGEGEGGQLQQDEIVISAEDGMGENITVSVDSGEVETQETVVDLGDIFAASQDEEMGGSGGKMEREILNIIKADDVGGNNKPVLPPIPFSFPGQTFDTKCQKLILNVWDFFKKVKKNPDILDEIRTPQERAAAALHISAATIGKIGKNLKRTGKLETPGKKRKRSRPIVDSVNSTDEDVIRSIILEYRNNKIVPTLPMVLAEARHRINFTGGATSFRRVLQRMGFRNLSQKNVVRKAEGGSGTTTTLVTTGNPGGIATLKVIKKEVLISEDSSNPTYIQLNKPLVTYATTGTGGTPQKVQTVQQVQQHQQGGTIIGTSNSGSIGNTINFVTSGNHGGNSGNQIIQLTGSGGTSGGNQPIQLTQENAAALANAVQMGGGSQTFHIIGADNTLRPIQIVYASNIQ